MSLTEKEQAIKALHEASTGGVWIHFKKCGHVAAYDYGGSNNPSNPAALGVIAECLEGDPPEEDYEFIAAAHNIFPQLLATIEKLRGENDGLKETIEALNMSNDMKRKMNPEKLTDVEIERIKAGLADWCVTCNNQRVVAETSIPLRVSLFKPCPDCMSEESEAANDQQG